VSVTVTSSHANPIHPYGTIVTLTCAVELSPLVDVAVNVIIVWSGPAGFMTVTTAQLVMGSTTTNISTAVISSFGTEQSGVYSCRAITVSSRSTYLTSSDSLSGTFRITTSMIKTNCCFNSNN
jgi:hypothetical protein